MADSKANIAIIKGDGIGIDVTNAMIEVLDAAQKNVSGFQLIHKEFLAGATYYLETGQDIEPGAEQALGEYDAMFLGCIGLPDVRHSDGTEISPHLRLRDIYGLYSGVRPVKAYPNIPLQLADSRCKKIDLVILRESTEGMFYSAAVHGRAQVSDDEVRETLRITRATTEKLHRFAFQLARKRKRRGKIGRVTCVDKANVFTSMAFFRLIFNEISSDFGDIESDCNYVDAQALDLIRKPWEFDVLVMENMYGDIFSDLAGGLVGGLGFAPCAEIGDNHGLFQPSHGSAPDIMGKDQANPIAAILSGAMMLEYLGDKLDSDAMSEAGKLIDQAIERGFQENRLQPTEVGGNMGTRAITTELVKLVSESETRDFQPAC